MKIRNNLTDEEMKQSLLNIGFTLAKKGRFTIDINIPFNKREGTIYAGIKIKE